MIKELARRYEAVTGEKMILIKKVTGGKVWWDFIPETEIKDLKT